MRYVNIGDVTWTTTHARQELVAVDSYRYDEAWELEPARALSQYFDSMSGMGAALLDLRKPDHFVASHVPGAYNLPLQSMGALTPSPFMEASVLKTQWQELEAIFTTDRINAHDLAGKDVYVLCYHGDTARVATSILRARGIAANSVKGGYTALRREIPQLQMIEQGDKMMRQDWLSNPATPSQGLKSQAQHAGGQSGIAVGAT